MQMSSAAAMQQVASERQREEKLLARQAKLIPVAFSGPRPRLVSLVRLAVECQWNTGFFIIFPMPESTQASQAAEALAHLMVAVVCVLWQSSSQSVGHLAAVLPQIF